jgi:hypothetical protein
MVILLSAFIAFDFRQLNHTHASGMPEKDGMAYRDVYI